MKHCGKVTTVNDPKKYTYIFTNLQLLGKDSTYSFNARFSALRELVEELEGEPKDLEGQLGGSRSCGSSEA